MYIIWTTVDVYCRHVCFSVTMDEVEAQQTFDEFFEEVFCDMEDKVGLAPSWPLMGRWTPRGRYLNRLNLCLGSCEIGSPYWWLYNEKIKKY